MIHHSEIELLPPPNSSGWINNCPFLIRVLRPQTADFRRRLGRPALALFRPPA
jgi:hypothetical protein